MAIFKSADRILLEGKLPALKKDYLSGLSTIKLTKKYLPNFKGKSSTTLESVIKDMIAGKLPTKITKTELDKRPRVIGTTAKGVSPAQIILNNPKAKQEFVKFANTKGNTVLDSMKEAGAIAKKYAPEGAKIAGYTSRTGFKDSGLRKLITQNVQLGQQSVNPEVTKRFESIINKLKTTKLPTTEIKVDSPIVKKLAKELNLTPKSLLSNIVRIKENPERAGVSKDFLKTLRRFPDPGFMQSLLTVKGYSPKTVKTVKAVEEAASAFTTAGSQLEHALPKSIIKDFNLPRKYLLTAERTTNFLNQFKKQFDKQLLDAAKAHAAGDISYNDYKKEVARISKIVSDKTGGYKIGYVDFVDGKPTAVTPQESLLKGEGDLGKRTKGLKNYFKNIIYHNKLYDNYTKNPNDPAFGTLRKEIEQSKYNFVKEVEGEKTARAISKLDKPEQFFKLYQQNPDNIFFKALTKASGMVGGRGRMLLAGGATLPLLATALAAEEKTPEVPIKYNDEIGAFVDPKTDDKVSQATLLDWAANNPMPTAAIASTPLLSKTVRKGTGKLLKGLLSTLGSSAAGLTFAGATVKGNLEEGKNIVDATVDPMVGIELLYPEAAKRFGGKGLQNALGRALSLGRVGAMMTPVGIGITALGLGKMGIEAAMDEREKILGMTEEEKTNYLADQYESFGGVFGEGA
jgi:hypothetical protein